MQFEYECALTGVVEPGGYENDSDGLGDLPVGWTKIEITRRQLNPRWMLIQQVKEAMVEGLVQQFPEDIRDVQRYAVSVQVEAQFHGLEQDTPMYLPDIQDVVYISDNDDIVDVINGFRDTLGLELLELEAQEEAAEPEKIESADEDEKDEAADESAAK
jgi:hypothetical protein